MEANQVPGGASVAPHPPSYSQAANAPCSYVDFCPACLKQGGFASMPVFERFDILLGRANEWLAANSTWKVITCETVESKLTWSMGQPLAADTMTSTYYESGKASTVYNKSLRLWICNKTPADNPAPQQIGYLNVVPACISQGGFLSQPKFESFAETMQKFNGMISQQPIQGRVINMETQNMKFESWTGSVDPETCIWIEYGKRATFFLNIIRIFFEAGQGTVTSIGTADFVPAQVVADQTFSMGSFESLAATMTKANAWIAQQPPNINIVNVQSLDYKVDRTWGGGNLDTMRSLYYEAGKHATAYVRIIRAYWTQGTDFSNPPPRQHPLQISYRTFMPAQLTAGGVFTPATYETQVETMKRALAWCNATGAKIISAETVDIRTAGGQNSNPEVTYTYASGNLIKGYIIALRLYLDGVYNDPPPEALPPVPQIQMTQESGCCVIL